MIPLAVNHYKFPLIKLDNRSTILSREYSNMIRPSIYLEPYKDETAYLFVNQNRTWLKDTEHLLEQGVTISIERLCK